MNNRIEKNIYTAIATLALVFALSSCEKEIEVDLRSVPPRIVIEGMIQEDVVAMVKLSTTRDFGDDNNYSFLSGATVKVSDNEGNEEILTQDQSGWYLGRNLKGKAGCVYNLSVLYDDTEYTATSQMPPKVAIDSLTMYKIKMMDYALPMLHLTDPKGDVNQFYRCLLYINGTQRQDTRELVSSAEFADGSPLHLILPVFSENDDVIPIQKGDEILVEMQCIDKDAYIFYESLSNIENSLTNPVTNIKGGALGVFFAFSCDQMKIVVEWKD